MAVGKRGEAKRSVARFKLYLIARPLRATPALEAVLGEAEAPLRARVEAFIAGTAEGPILLVASDDRAAVDVHWERCNQERLAILIVDESTLWDRLRDRLQGRAPKPARPAVRPAAAKGESPDAPAPLPREGLFGASSFELSRRTRVGLMAACAFAALLGLALAVAPDNNRPTGAPTTSRTGLARNAGGGGRTQALPNAGGGDLGAGTAGRGGTEGDASQRGGGGGCARSPGGEALSSPAALLFAFLCGFGIAWGAGLVVDRRGAALSRENLRAARQVTIFLAALVAASSVLLRLAAISAAREVAPPVEDPAEATADAGAGESPEALGPFARFLRQRRGTGRRGPVFRELLDDWRARHGGDGGAGEGDASLDVTLTEDGDAGAPAASVDAGRHHREHRRHERHARRRHGDARDASTDVAAADVPDDVAEDVADDAATSAGSVSASLPAGPRGTTEPSTPAEPAASAEPARPSRRATTVARAPRREPPRDERTPVSPVTTFALGVAAGLVLSPRWRALARGDR